MYEPPEDRLPPLDPNTASTMDIADAAAADLEAQRAIDEAVVLVAEMELTAEELRLGMRALRAQRPHFGSVFGAEDPAEVENRIKTKVKDVYGALVERVPKELAELPFPSIAAAQAAVDLRNAKYRGPNAGPLFDGAVSDSEGAPEGAYIGAEARRGLTERLEEAERVAERFVARRLQPAVEKVRGTSPEGVIQSVQRSALWARGLWDRLNGASSPSGSGAAPEDLPLPIATDAQRGANVEALLGEISELEAKLQEASKARETRLRKAGIQGRARMAAELRQMDNEVAGVSRALAVRTLQLEMEFIYGCLEGEALDILGDPSAAAAAAERRGAPGVALALARRGSTDEVALLVAEFCELDAELAAMVSVVESGGALYLDDGELAALATEIPDLRLRLGVGDEAVFGGTKFSLSKVQMQVRGSIMKVMEAFTFGVRGVRLLGSDVAAAAALFLRALAGGTLKPREVAALRRTARDLLTFVPFTVILILPLTPVGHVLIFGFIQRYFPGFFPSQFTSRRQDLMMKYEELKEQLAAAQAAAEAESDELEFQKKAAAAKAALSKKTGVSAEVVEASLPVASAHNGGAGSGGADAPLVGAAEGDEDGEDGPAAQAVKKLEKELAAAADSSYTDMDD